MDPIEAVARAIHADNIASLLQTLDEDSPMARRLRNESWDSLEPEARHVLLKLATAAVNAYVEAMSAAR